MDNPNEVKSLYSIFKELQAYEQFLRNFKEVTNVESAKIIKWVKDNPKGTREEYDTILKNFNKHLKPYDYRYNKTYIGEIQRLLRKIDILLAERNTTTEQILRAVNNSRISNLQTLTYEKLQSNDVSLDPNIGKDRAMTELLKQYPKEPLGGKSKKNHKNKHRKSRKGRKGRKSRKST